MAFFSTSLIDSNTQAHQGWFSFEGVPLKWHYPVGLLFDLYAGGNPATSRSMSENEPARSPTRESEGKSGLEYHLPWRLTVHFSDWPDQDLVRLDSEGKVLHDAFINSVKEADFLRNGTAKGIMALSKEDSSGLWQAVQDHDFMKYQRISNILITSSSNQFRNIPLRIFIPSPPDSASPSLKVVQSPVSPVITNTTNQRTRQTQKQTVGSALNSLLPSLFPSKRVSVLARPVLHGAVVPMSASVEEVVRCAAYTDGWLAIVVSMVG